MQVWWGAPTLSWAAYGPYPGPPVAGDLPYAQDAFLPVAARAAPSADPPARRDNSGNPEDVYQARRLANERECNASGKCSENDRPTWLWSTGQLALPVPLAPLGPAPPWTPSYLCPAGGWGWSGAGVVWGEALGVSWRLLGLVGTFSCGQLDVLWGFLGVLEVSCNL